MSPLPPRSTAEPAARDGALAALLAEAGWADAERSLLAGDASFRRYDRLKKADGTRAVLMDAPPPMEDVRPFLAIARHLSGLGLSAPAILAADETHGFLLLEDLGDATYTRLLAQGHDEEALYALAMDTLARLHALPIERALPAALPAYDDERLMTEAMLLPEWYLPAVDITLSADALAAYRSIWRDLFPLARRVPDSLVLRDFHVDNLLLLPERADEAACGLLDFQDAVRGPLTYDPMSLLEDARRDIESDLIARMKNRYLDKLPALDREAFAESWAVLAAQRHAKVIGIFTRLDARDGKPHYLDHISRLWRLMDGALTHPSLAPLAQWFDRYVPPSARRVPPSRPGQASTQSAHPPSRPGTPFPAP